MRQRRDMAAAEIDGLGSLEAALAAQGADDWVIVDLDETLWLRNSTEAFLDHARPRFLVATLLTLIDALRPWRLIGPGVDAAFVWRDWWRVTLTLALTPWNYWRWRRHAPKLAWKWRNPRLLALLDRHDRGRRAGGRLVVASLGFGPIVRPLMQGLLADVPVVAASLARGARDRAAGKWALLGARLELAALRRALFITDHAGHDGDVLRQVARPVVVRWPEARFEPACTRVYVPFRYTLEGKHVGHNHLRVFLTTDAVALLLAVAPAVGAPVAAALAGLFLMASFFVVFEIGYHENDALGAEREAAPTLTEARLRRLGTVVEAKAWGWALALALPGLALLASHEIPAWTNGTWRLDLPWLGAAWLALLLATRGMFATFNRIDEISRVLLYLPLQATKGLGIVLALALPVTVAGVALLLALPIARWIPYVIYRHAGIRWQTPDRLHRLILVVVALAALLPVVARDALSPLGIALVLAWCTLQARHQLLAAWRRATWLQPRPEATTAARATAKKIRPPRKVSAKGRHAARGALRAPVSRKVSEPLT